MKKSLSLFLICFLSLAVRANTEEIIISDSCKNHIQKNLSLQKKLDKILIQVSEHSKDQSLGYNEKTASLLIQAACVPFEEVNSQEKSDICSNIISNIELYNKNPNDGYSLQTAKLLEKMSGLKCLKN